MKRQFVWGTILAAAVAVSAGAQTPPTSTGQQDRTKSDDRQQTVTVGGCLQRADQTTAGASGTAGSAGTGTAGSSSAASGARSSSPDEQFVLTNAQVTTGSSAAGTTGSTSGTATSTTPGSSSASSGISFKLKGGDQKELERYVNQRVEIRGRIEKDTMSDPSSSSAGSTSGSATSGSGTGSTAGRASSGGADVTAHQVLRVSSIRATSGSCSGESR